MFRNNQGTYYTVELDSYNNEIKEINFSDNPVTIKYEGTEDYFKPIKASSATVRINANSSMLDLYTSEYNRKCRIYADRIATPTLELYNKTMPYGNTLALLNLTVNNGVRAVNNTVNAQNNNLLSNSGNFKNTNGWSANSGINLRAENNLLKATYPEMTGTEAKFFNIENVYLEKGKTYTFALDYEADGTVWMELVKPWDYYPCKYTLEAGSHRFVFTYTHSHSYITDNHILFFRKQNGAQTVNNITIKSIMMVEGTEVPEIYTPTKEETLTITGALTTAVTGNTNCYNEFNAQNKSALEKGYITNEDDGNIRRECEAMSSNLVRLDNALCNFYELALVTTQLKRAIDTYYKPYITAMNNAVNLMLEATNPQKIIFDGYITPNRYSQDWLSNNYELEVECIDNLAVTEFRILDDTGLYGDIKVSDYLNMLLFSI